MRNPFSQVASNLGFNKRSANIAGLEQWANLGRVKRREYSDKDLEDADSIHSYVYGSVRAIADNVASTPISLYRDNERMEQDKALKLIQNPYAHMTENALKEVISRHLLLTGDCFIETILDKYEYEDGRTASVPSKLIPIIPPSRVDIVPGEEQQVDHYEYAPPSGGEDLILDVDEVVHIKLFGGTSKLYGLSPLQALKEELFTDAKAVEFSKQFFENSAAPGGILSFEENLDRDAKDDVAKRWNKAHRGPSNAQKIAVLDRGVEYQPVTLSQEDMQFIEQRQLTKRDIRAIYGVPSTYLGETSATYASASEASRAFFLNVVIPLANKISEALTKYVLKRHWPNKNMKYDFNFMANESLVPLIQEKAQLQQSMISAGIPPNIATKMIWGQEFYDEEIGSTAYLPANLVPIGSVPTSVKTPGPQLSFDTEKKEVSDNEDLMARWRKNMSEANYNINFRESLREQ